MLPVGFAKYVMWHPIIVSIPFFFFTFSRFSLWPIWCWKIYQRCILTSCKPFQPSERIHPLRNMWGLSLHHRKPANPSSNFIFQIGNFAQSSQNQQALLAFNSCFHTTIFQPMTDFLRSLHKPHIIYNSFIRPGEETALKISALKCSRVEIWRSPTRVITVFYGQVYLSLKVNKIVIYRINVD